MDESLFTTRQLTEYREWSDGRKGYLFYVSNRQDGTRIGRGCLALINGNSLEWEVFESVDERQVITGGFWAFLIAQGCIKLKQRDQLETLWRVYCEYQENLFGDCFLEKREIHEMHILEDEADIWINFPVDKADIAIRQLYPDATIADFKQLVTFFLRSKMKQYEQDTYRLMWELQPYLYFPKDHRIAICDRTSLVSSVWFLSFSESPDFEIVGFPARLLNYMVSHFACQEGTKMDDADKLSHWIHKCFAFIDYLTNGAILPEWIDFDFDGMNIKDIYEAYIEECRKYCTIKLLKNSDFAYASPQEQEYRIIHDIVRDECNTQKIQNPILPYLTEKQRIAYEGLIYSFVMTLLKKLEGSEKYEDKDTDLVLDSFNDMIQRLLDAGYLVMPQQPEQQSLKFQFILSDNPEQIKLIHMRIELSLDSPAKLRDVLKQLEAEQKLALPSKAVDIFPEIKKIWPQCTIKPHSFATTWARRK